MRKPCKFLKDGQVTEGYIVAERREHNEIDIEVDGVTLTYLWAGQGGVTWVAEIP